MQQKHVVVYGGQYGSEGKASAAEYWARKFKEQGHWLVAIGENSPNSGHRCSRGATKSIPACSFWADAIILGPDAVVDPRLLVEDWLATGRKPLYVHEHAALLFDEDREKETSLVERISSTGSGSGSARGRKFIERQAGAVVKGTKFPTGIFVVDDSFYSGLVASMLNEAVIMECSQGVMLDTNFGRYPYVTSRSTLPRVAVERNGLGALPWQYCGVYRTFPIRTGGCSGPTGGVELSWNEVGAAPEIATVTKRERRIFSFSTSDFCKSIRLARPDMLMFTFLDYIGVKTLDDLAQFEQWLDYQEIGDVRKQTVLVSNRVGHFVHYAEKAICAR